MKKATDNKRRILARQVAKELTVDELKAITGGTTSCSCGGADDCDKAPL